MTVENTREKIQKHENQEYIDSRPQWVTGHIPALSDYRKLSVNNFEEAFKLAKLGQQVTTAILPTFHGKPLLLTFTQALIIGAAILSREQAEKMGLNFEKYRSVLMVCPSRYGKSFLNAIVAIIKAGTEGKEVRIGGATAPKAGIIQEKVVTLLPDTIPAIQNGLVVTSEDGDVNKKVKRLATQASKEALQWQNGGSIKLFSTNEGKKNAEVGAAGAIGVGGDFVILDEIQLMTPVGFRTASRFMMENANTKRFCVGNPQINGHFKDLYDDPETFVVHINDTTAIIEGRMSRHGFELTGIPTYSEEYRAFIMCVDDQTECLTPNGWKSIKDIKEGDIIAQIGENESVGFVPVQHKTETIANTVYKTSFSQDEWIFTKDHRQYVYNTSRKTGKTEKKVYRMEKLPKGSHIKILSGGNNPSNRGITSLDRLAIACQADGSIETVYQGKLLTKPKDFTRWRLEIKKQRKIERIKTLLEEAQVRYDMTIKKDGKVRFNFILPSIITKELPDWFGWEIGNEDAKMLLDEIMEWDGCRANQSYSSVNKTNADFVQSLAAQCGLRTTLRSVKMWNGNTIYTVHIHKTNARTTQHMTKEEIEWNKPVYCVTVPSGEWLARRNGHVINTGNCEFPDENSGTRFFPTLPTMFDETKMPQPRSKQYFMGIDSAYKGGDSLLVTILSLNNLADGSRYAVVEQQIDLKQKYPEWTEDTTTNIVLDILRLWQGKGVMAGAIDIGFGIHIYERIMQLDPDCNLEPVNFAQKPTEWRVESDYSAKMAANARAEMHLDLRDICESHLMYIRDGDCYDTLLRQMREVGNKTDNLTAKIRIEAKKDIKNRLGRSPDNLDSLCLSVRAMVLSGVLEGRGNDPEADDLIMEVF
jgi:hypothetical protein